MTQKISKKKREKITKKSSGNVRGTVRTTKFQKKKNEADAGSGYSRSDERHQATCLRSLRISK